MYNNINLLILYIFIEVNKKLQEEAALRQNELSKELEKAEEERRKRKELEAIKKRNQRDLLEQQVIVSTSQFLSHFCANFALQLKYCFW